MLSTQSISSDSIYLCNLIRCTLGLNIMQILVHALSSVVLGSKQTVSWDLFHLRVKKCWIRSVHRGSVLQHIRVWLRAAIWTLVTHQGSSIVNVKSTPPLYPNLAKLAIPSLNSTACWTLLCGGQHTRLYLVVRSGLRQSFETSLTISWPLLEPSPPPCNLKKGRGWG